MSVICYMSVICLVLGGVVRVRLYIIYAHLCNHILLQSGGWDLGHSSVHCGGVGSGSRDAAPGPDPRIRHRIQIGMFRPIRLDHTNCLQVVIKTHSFIDDGERGITVLLHHTG